MSDKGDGNDQEDAAQWSEVKRYRNRLSSKKTREKERSLMKTLGIEKERLHLSNTALQFHNRHLREAILAIKKQKTKPNSLLDGVTMNVMPGLPENQSGLLDTESQKPITAGGVSMNPYQQALQGNWSQHSGIPNATVSGTLPYPQSQQVAQIIANSLQAQQLLQQLMPPPSPNTNNLQSPPNPLHPLLSSSLPLNQGVFLPTLTSLGAQQQPSSQQSQFAPLPTRTTQVNSQDSSTWHEHQNASSEADEQEPRNTTPI